MAVKNMTPIKGEVNKLTGFAFEAATVAADGMKFQLPRKSDEYVVVVIHNTATAEHSFTVKAPTKGSYAAATSDETIKVAAGAFAFFRFESARYANTDGTVLCVPENVAVKAAVLY